MAKQKTVKHVHKYMRTQLTHVTVWRCAECNHWMPPYLNNLMEGRKSICWGCSKEFKLDEASMVDDMPMCFTCRTPATVVDTPLGDVSLIEQFLREKEKVNG